MILSKATETASVAALARMPSFLRTLIQNSSVKLEGSHGRVRFNGSGAILFRDATNTWIVTAKHNLYILNDNTDAPPWDEALVTRFRDSIRIYYDGPMAYGKEPARVANITSIVPIPKDTARPWDYDVMILKSTDGPLREFATINAVGNPFDRTRDDYAEIWKDREYLTTAGQYLERRGQHFLQTGYGRITESFEVRVKKKTETIVIPPAPSEGEARAGNALGALQFRTTMPMATATTTVYSQRGRTTAYDRFDQAFQVTANENSSTAPGDSGGPLFAVREHVDSDPSKSFWRLYLIGVTTGADMATAATPCPTGTTLRSNNVVTSLEHAYNTLFP